MEEILREILAELKWHTKQNDKITELLGRLRQPCGQQRGDISDMVKLLRSTIQAGKVKNPMMESLLNQAEELIKKQGGGE